MKIPNLIGYQTSAAGSINYQTINPITDQLHPELFVEATAEEIERTMDLAHAAYRPFSRLSPLKRAAFLNAIASKLEAHRTLLIQTYCSESGLSEQRAEVELARTTHQLSSFADLLSSENWEIKHHVDAVPERTPFPKPSLTKYKLGIGPIVVFGASNFPFAYSTVGGDTAAALAAGCPVIVKSHPFHAHTSYQVAQLVVEVAKQHDLPEGVFSHLNTSGHEVGKQLVLHPHTKGVGFTGSIKGGLALQQLAQQRNVPIPVFAEMGSLNPVVILPSALSSNLEDIATKLAISITKDAGQFCTKPGALFLVKSATSDCFLEVFKTVFEQQATYSMVHPTISHNYTKRAKQVIEQADVQLFAKGIPTDTCNVGVPQLSITDGKTFDSNKLLQEEVFGPHAIMVICESQHEMEQILENISGQLTFSIFHNEENLPAQNLFYLAQEKAGRVILNGVPTGVEVSVAMQHGGPFPSSSDSRFTAVGADAIERFVRGVTVQK
jgi:alpha-ketoglutaric semialdehyde dehydrogenase